MTKADDELAAALVAEAMDAAKASPPDDRADTLERMQELASEVADIDERIAKNEARIRELQARRVTIVTGDLVSLMDDAHVSMLEVGSNVFKAQAYYKAVIPIENPEPGLNWLEANDAGDLIKNEVVLAFPRGAEDDAKLAEDLCRKRFQQADVIRKRTVHWATLTSWLKETHEGGHLMPPLELIGGAVGRIVKITTKKD
jgi:hypothetical protein